jgi:hypothetical protein
MQWRTYDEIKLELELDLERRFDTPDGRATVFRS